MSAAVWIARSDSRHFDFRGYGHTKEQAAEALRAALRAHVAAVPGCSPDFIREQMAGANLQAWNIGAGYRDDYEIAPDSKEG